MNLFVCEVNENVAFRQPPEGKVYILHLHIHVFRMKIDNLFEPTFRALHHVAKLPGSLS